MFSRSRLRDAVRLYTQAPPPSFFKTLTTQMQSFLSGSMFYDNQKNYIYMETWLKVHSLECLALKGA